MRNKMLLFICFMFFLFAFAGCSEKEYSVTFKDSLGNTIETVTLKDGDALEYPEYNLDGYFLDSWDKELDNITEDTIITANLTKITKKYTYLNNEKVLKEESIDYDKTSTPPDVELEEKYSSYEWALKSKVETGSVYEYIYEIVFTPIKKEYIYKDNGEVIKEETLDFDAVSTKPTINLGEKYSSYEWKLVSKTETGEKYSYVYEVEYTIKTFTVTFKDSNGDIIDEERVNYGESATAPNVETIREYTWDKEFSNVTQNLVVTIQYLTQIYEITYYDGASKLNLTPNTYEKDDNFALPKHEKEGYFFVGWFASDISLFNITKIDASMEGDITLYARYVETSEKEPLVLPETEFYFTAINKTPHSSGNGTFVYQPKFPTGVSSTSVLAYDWSTSDSTIATVSAYSSISGKSAGFCILTATLKTDASVKVCCVIKVTSEGVSFATVEEANEGGTCEVTFVDKDNNVISKTITTKGGSVIYPIPPLEEGLMFTGWDKSNYNITADTTIKATYKEGNSNYQGKKIALIGDSISTYEGYIPEGYSCFYPYPTADVNDVNQTWWMEVVNKIGAGMFINNSYSGSCVGTDISSSSKNDTRLSKLVINNIKPDVIIIYMGSNDCASSYVSLSAYTSSYKIMIEKLQVLCPESEIVLCTMPTSNLYTNANKELYNKVILDYADEFSLNVIDFASVDITPHLVDSAHPNKEGMMKIAEKAIADLQSFVLE